MIKRQVLKKLEAIEPAAETELQCGLAICDRPADNMIELYDPQAKKAVLRPRCRPHTSRYHKVVVGPGALI